MGAIERLGEKKREAIPVNPPGEKEAEIKGPTLNEIMADKGRGGRNELFGLYLGQEGEEELGARLAAGKLEPEDFKQLDERRKNFLEIMEISKNTIDSLDAASLEKIIEVSPELKTLKNLGNTEGIRNAILRHLPRVAILDREHFKDLSKRMVQLGETKKAVAEENKNVARLCKEYGISEEKYVEMLQGGARKELEELVAGKLGAWKLLTTSTKKIIEKIDELDRAKAVNGHLVKLNADLAGVAGSLGATLMENDTLRETLSAGIIGETGPKFESGMALGEVKRPKKEDVEKEWEQFSVDYERKYGFRPESSHDSHYEEALDEFSQGYTSKAMKGKKGFWASISEAFWGSMIKDFVKKK